MQQRCLPEIGVDQRDNDANLRQTQPSANELWTIFHEQSNNIASLEAILLEQIRNTIRKFVHIAERPFLILVNQTSFLWMLGNIMMKYIGYGDILPLITLHQ